MSRYISASSESSIVLMAININTPQCFVKLVAPRGMWDSLPVDRNGCSMMAAIVEDNGEYDSEEIKEWFFNSWTMIEII